MNNVDFKVQQKTESDGTDCTLDGKPFQTGTSATGIAQRQTDTQTDMTGYDTYRNIEETVQSNRQCYSS